MNGQRTKHGLSEIRWHFLINQTTTQKPLFGIKSVSQEQTFQQRYLLALQHSSFKYLYSLELHNIHIIVIVSPDCETIYPTGNYFGQASILGAASQSHLNAKFVEDTLSSSLEQNSTFKYWKQRKLNALLFLSLQHQSLG